MLMVSGIGPKATLDSLGIDVISDRAGVGQNMWVRHSSQSLCRRSLRLLLLLTINRTTSL